MCGEAARPPVYLMSSFVIVLSIVLKCATARARLGRRSKGANSRAAVPVRGTHTHTVCAQCQWPVRGAARAREAASDYGITGRARSLALLQSR